MRKPSDVLAGIPKEELMRLVDLSPEFLGKVDKAFEEDIREAVTLWSLCSKDWEVRNPGNWQRLNTIFQKWANITDTSFMG